MDCLDSWHVNFWYDKKAYLASSLQENDRRETLIRIVYDSSIIGGVNKKNVKSLSKQRLQNVTALLIVKIKLVSVFKLIETKKFQVKGVSIFIDDKVFKKTKLKSAESET